MGEHATIPLPARTPAHTRATDTAPLRSAYGLATRGQLPATSAADRRTSWHRQGVMC